MIYILQIAIWAGVMVTNAYGHWAENWWAASAVGAFMAWGVTHSIAQLLNGRLATDPHHRPVRDRKLVLGKELKRVKCRGDIRVR